MIEGIPPLINLLFLLGMCPANLLILTGGATFLLSLYNPQRPNESWDDYKARDDAHENLWKWVSYFQFGVAGFSYFASAALIVGWQYFGAVFTLLARL